MRALRRIRAGTRARLIAAALLASLVVALVLVVATGDSPSPQKRQGSAPDARPHGAVLSGTWAFRPQTVAELVAKSPAVVAGTVVAISAGPPLTDGAEDGGLPTQRIRITVDDRVYGDVPDTFELFKTGSNDRWIEGDPPYEVGERYVFFLQPRVNGDGSVEPDTYVPVAPDGRLKIDRDSVHQVIGGFLSEKLNGDSVGAVKRAAAAARKGG
jgi:hypothetical protein